MKQVVPIFGLLLLGLAAAPGHARAAEDAAVAGVVRDLHGTPQMGALVELLAPDAAVVARAFTDNHGRYLLRAIHPGKYELRASAAFLRPLLQRNLHLHPGAQAVANLSMAAIFEAGAWIPAERRSSSEPGDDWKWSLRSNANRPLLRLVDEDDSAPDSTSSSIEHPGGMARAEGHFAVLSGDGTFAEGGTHQLLLIEHTAGTGEVSTLRADLGDPASAGLQPSTAVAVGFSRKLPFNGSTRILADFSSHPEIAVSGGLGLEVAHVATAERFALGDTLLIDAGSLLTAERLAKAQVTAAPYVRVRFNASDEISIEYRFATDRLVQGIDDLDHLDSPVETLSGSSGRPLSRKGLHQELALAHTTKRDVIRVAVFQDQLAAKPVAGVGQLGSADVAGSSVLQDVSMGLFRLAVAGFDAKGVSVAWSRELGTVLSADMEADLGRALTDGAGEVAFSELPAAIKPRLAPAVRTSLRLDTPSTGTRAKLSYHWQPLGTLTQVNEFNARANEAYLGFSVRQRVWSGRRLQGLEAVLEASNLLAEGYQSATSADGRTLVLAQVPRAVQGGFLFSF